MTGPGQPRTCSHPINAQTLTGICQVVRMFSPCQYSYQRKHFNLSNKLVANYTVPTRPLHIKPKEVVCHSKTN